MAIALIDQNLEWQRVKKGVNGVNLSRVVKGV